MQFVERIKARRRKAGRPPFEPTDEQRRFVEALVGFGLTHRDIAGLIVNPNSGRQVSLMTLHKHFRRELDQGAAKANARVAQSLFNKATGDGPGSVTAAIWWTKCRMGWKGEHITHEIDSRCGVLVAPAAMTPAEWIEEQMRKNSERRGPSDEES